MPSQIINFFLAFFLWAGFFAFAQSTPYYPFPLNKPLIKKIKEQSSSLISDRLGAYILRASALAENKKQNKAIDLLEHHYQKARWTKSEKAQIAGHLGRLYKQIDQNKKALAYLREALSLKALPYAEHLSVLYYIAQIYIERDNFETALQKLKLWFSINENPAPSSYILLAHCYYAKGQNKKALKYVEKTLSLVTKPMESWLKFAAVIYLKQKKYEKAQPHLEKLVALYPSKASHWKQLAGVYLHLDKTAKAFVTLDMAERMGHLKNLNDFINLSSLYVERGLPYQGAKLLKKKIKQKLIPKEQKNLEFLATALWLAREEKESLAYLKIAAKKAKEPLFFIKYGQKLLDQQQWLLAEKVFKKALNTKKIKETAQQIKNYKQKLAKARAKEMDLKWKELLQIQNSGRDSVKTDEKDPGRAETQKDKDSLSAQGSIRDFVKADKKDLELGKDSKSPSQKAVIAKESLIAQNKPPSTERLEHIYLGIGVALYNREKYTEALSYFKKSIEVKDTFISGYQWIEWTEDRLLEQKAQAKS